MSGYPGGTPSYRPSRPSSPLHVSPIRRLAESASSAVARHSRPANETRLRSEDLVFSGASGAQGFSTTTWNPTASVQSLATPSSSAQARVAALLRSDTRQSAAVAAEEERLAAELRRTRKKLQEQETTVRDLNSSRMDATRTQQENARLQRKVSELESSENWYKEELERMRQALREKTVVMPQPSGISSNMAADMADRMRRLTAENQVLSDEVSSLRMQLRAETDAANELRRMAPQPGQTTIALDELAELRVELAFNRSSRDQLASEVDQHLATIARLSAEYDTNQGLLRTAEDQLMAVARQLEVYQSEATTRQHRVQEEMTSLQSEVARLRQENEIATLTMQLTKLKSNEFPIWKTQFLQRRDLDPYVQKVVLTRLDASEADILAGDEEDKRKRKLFDKTKEQATHQAEELTTLRKDFAAMELAVERFLALRKKEIDHIESELTDMAVPLPPLPEETESDVPRTVAPAFAERVREAQRRDEVRLQRIRRVLRSIKDVDDRKGIEITELQTKLSSTVSMANTRGEEVNAAVREARALREEVDYRREEATRLRDESMAGDGLRLALDERITALTGELERVRNEAVAIDADRTRLRNELSRMASDVENLTAATKARLEEKERIETAFEDELAATGREKQLLLKQIAELGAENQETENARKDLADNLDEAVARLAQMDLRAEAAAIELRAAETRLSQSAVEAARGVTERESLQAELTRAMSTIESLSLNLESARGWEKDARDMRMENGRLKNQLQERETAWTIQRDELIRSQAHVSELDATVLAQKGLTEDTRLQRERLARELDDSRATIKSNMNTLADRHADIEALKSEVRRLQNDCQLRGERLFQAEERAKSVESTRLRTEEMLDALRGQLSSSVRQVQEKDGQLSELRSELERAHIAARDQEATHAEAKRRYETADARVASVERDFTLAQDRLTSQNETIAELNAKIREWERKYALVATDLAQKLGELEGSAATQAQQREELVRAERLVYDAGVSKQQMEMRTQASMQDLVHQLQASASEVTLARSELRMSQDAVRGMEIALAERDARNNELEDLLVRQDSEMRRLRERAAATDVLESNQRESNSRLAEQRKETQRREEDLIAQIQAIRAEADAQALSAEGRARDVARRTEEELLAKLEIWENRHEAYLMDIANMETLILEREDEIQRLTDEIKRLSDLLYVKDEEMREPRARTALLERDAARLGEDATRQASQLRESEHSVIALTRQLGEASDELERKRRQIADLESASTQLRDDLRQARETVARLQERTGSDSDIGLMRERIERDRVALETANADVRMLQEKLRLAERAITSAEAGRAAAEGAARAAEERAASAASTVTRQLQIASDRAAQAEQAEKDVREDLRRAERLLREREEEVARVTRHIQDAEDRLSEKRDAAAKSEHDRERTLAQRDAEIDRLAREVAAATQALRQQEGFVQRIQAESEADRRALTDLRVRDGDLEMQHRNDIAELAMLRQQASQYQLQLVTDEARTQNKEAEVTRLEGEIRRLADENSHLQRRSSDDVERARALERELSLRDAEMLRLNAASLRYEEEVNKLQSALADLRTRAAVESAVAAVSPPRSRLDVASRDLADKRAAHNAEIAAMRRDLADKNEQIRLFKQRVGIGMP